VHVTEKPELNDPNIYQKDEAGYYSEGIEFY
jgi:hypothetical protein